jgi:hypothetical protein
MAHHSKSHAHHKDKMEHHKAKMEHHKKEMHAAKSGSKKEYGSMDKKPLSHVSKRGAGKDKM